MSASNVILEMGRPQDLHEISAISADLIEGGLAQRWTPIRLARVMEHSEATLLVARLEGKLIGFALMVFEEQRAHLYLLAVKWEHQGQGLGRRLVQALETTARAAGIKRVFVEVRALNHGGRAFYRRLRYREHKLLRKYYQGVEDAVRMVRRFNKPSEKALAPYYEAIDNLLESL